MKKIVFIILSLFVFSVRADNTITSKEYVDTQAGGLQEQISANDANTVLTYTDTAGTVGEKEIYDSSDDYASQQDALVTAGAFNTAVQNALNTEFVCIERQAGTGGCLLYQIRAPYQKSKNLANFDDVYYNSRYWSVDDTTKTIHGRGSDTNFSFFLRNVKQNEVYTISANYLNIVNKSNFSLRDYDTPSFVFADSEAFSDTGLHSWSFNIPADGNYRVNIRCAGTASKVTATNIQLEEGTVATPYVPYGNIYLPQN